MPNLTPEELIEKMAHNSFDLHCVDCKWEELEKRDKDVWITDAEEHLRIVLSHLRAGGIVQALGCGFKDEDNCCIVLNPEFEAFLKGEGDE